ncbi:MAG: deoxyribodipyrimidine photo-lyase, partial [Rhodoferax sp.]|nr:deoxyribodipyrimidine photo-lyase [Rhodoferax sp.]
MTQNFETGLIWFRRDLRVMDNAALHMALSQCRQVHCVFVFDQDILAPLPRVDRRVEFIRESLVELDAALRQLSGKAGAGLIVRHAVAMDEIPRLAAALQVQAVFAARDYEPEALARDEAVRQALAQAGCA